jgi:hypothetical protein
MPIVRAPTEYDAWLTCSVQESPHFFAAWPGPLEAEPAPLPPRPPARSQQRADDAADPAGAAGPAGPVLGGLSAGGWCSCRASRR